MNSNIIEHIERVRKTLSECVDEHEIVEQVTASKNILVSGPVSLPPEKRRGQMVASHHSNSSAQSVLNRYA